MKLLNIPTFYFIFIIIRFQWIDSFFFKKFLLFLLLLMTSNDSSQQLTCKHNDSLKLNSQSTSYHVKTNIIFTAIGLIQNQWLKTFNFNPFQVQSFLILLCHLLSMLLVPPSLISYLLNLEKIFIHKFKIRSDIFYVSLGNSRYPFEITRF